jgi:two-component system sensor histidine kinase KdpD
MTRFAAAGLPRVRALSGAGCGAAGLALLTPLLVMARDRLGLAEVALLDLVPVIAAAAIGGLWPALLVALAADLLVNFFFPPALPHAAGRQPKSCHCTDHLPVGCRVV